jgi:nicotinamidase-related amidase
MATVTSAVLILIYWLAPPGPGSHRLHVLLIDCIPDAVIVLVAIPIVYWLFYRRGLTNMGDCPLFSEDGDAKIADPQPQPHRCDRPAWSVCEKAFAATPNNEEPRARQDVLLVVEAEGGSAAGSPESPEAGKALAALKAEIRSAGSRKMPVLFAREQCATTHHMDNQEGSADPRALCRPAGSAVFARDADPENAAGALANPALDLIVSHPRLRTVYVAGIAPAGAVQATCRAVLRRGKKAVLLEAAGMLASDDAERTEIAWRRLADEGLARIDRLPPAGPGSDGP